MLAAHVWGLRFVRTDTKSGNILYVTVCLMNQSDGLQNEESYFSGFHLVSEVDKVQDMKKGAVCYTAFCTRQRPRGIPTNKRKEEEKTTK
jgi:hypothetical protein